MATIKAPFNFVPLSDKVFFPDWANKISHDIPFEDGEDGVITLTIKNETPLFIRDGHAKEESTEWSCHIKDEKGNKRYFIPGTTLKGCFRSVMEVLSYAKLNRYNNDSFGYRSFTTQIKGVNYADKMKNVKHCGWLYRDGDNYFIEECVNGIQKIRHSEIRKRFKNFDVGADHQTAERKQRSLTNGKELYPTVIVGENNSVTYKENNTEKHVPHGQYRLVCTGYMKGKKVEYLFDTNLKESATVSEVVFKRFDTIHAHTPYYAGQNGKDGFLKNILKQGGKIPVFFEKNGSAIGAIGITRMFRYPFDNSVSSCIENLSKQHFSKDLDLVESIFGYISSDSQLRGRVHIGNAFSDYIISDDSCELINGVFGTPRASYYPLYVKQLGKSISNYSTQDAQLAGRKRYRITKNAQTLKLGTGNGNERMIVSFRPLPQGMTFECKINVHNLKKVEIGALLSAITFNETPGCFHNIGLAKSFGYGAVSCEVSLSQDFKYSKEEYEKEFNKEISYFLQQRNSSLAFEQSLRQLVAIASAVHNIDDMVQMSFEECEQFKEDRNMSLLNEPQKQISILIDEKVAFESKDKERLENERVEKEKRREEERREREEKERQMRLAAEQAQAELEQRKADRLAAGFSFLLEERVDGNGLKIQELSTGVNRINQFLMKNAGYAITDNDKNAVSEWLKKLPQPTKKADKKEYENFDSKSWKQIASFVGQDTAQQLFSEIIHP
ncbi:MAG: TIGR03986 family CRISPR-associated RAMP protein [Paludibacteraceae bacterium]|nr:TIGR03986 family CRISPR-associated RAMP protein [Paludibacteraceae bacterium]